MLKAWKIISLSTILIVLACSGCSKENYEHQHHYDYIKADSCYRKGHVKIDSIVMPKKPHIIGNIKINN